MTIAAFDLLRRPAAARPAVSPRTARVVVGLTIILASVAGVVIGSGGSVRAVADAGADLTRLLRFMAVLKAAMALAAAGAVMWRLGAPIAVPRLFAYAGACAAMAAGPGLIWTMAHVGLGALLLHGGLLACLLMLWRDPATTGLLIRRMNRPRTERRPDP